MHRVGGMTGKVEEALGYEQARDELIEVVRRLEAGGTTLEESRARGVRGAGLAHVWRRRRGRAPGPPGPARAEEEAGDGPEETGDDD